MTEDPTLLSQGDYNGTGNPTPFKPNILQEPYKPLPGIYNVPVTQPSIVNVPSKTKREIAVELSIKFCEGTPTDTNRMLEIAEKIYQFLIK